MFKFKKASVETSAGAFFVLLEHNGTVYFFRMTDVWTNSIRPHSLMTPWTNAIRPYQEN
jgi:hypothetical protein